MRWIAVQPRPALGIEDSLPADLILLAGRMAQLHAVAGVRGQVLADKGADFLAEGAFLRGEA
jgi:hypothetical protein